MLPKEKRIPRKLFAEILQSRQFKNSTHFTLRYVTGGNTTRFAASVSKKISKSAVVRNRIRRRVYAVLPQATPGLYLIVAKSGSEKIKGEALRSELAKLLEKS